MVLGGANDAFSKGQLAVGRVHFPPFGLMTKVRISLLAINQDPLLALKGHSQVLDTCPSLTGDQNMVVVVVVPKKRNIKTFHITFLF